MAIIVEDGTGLANANSYASVSFADTYFADRANTVWSALTAPQKEASLIQATDYINTRWGHLFKGLLLVEGQALLFPRSALPACAGTLPMPTALLKAAAEYALRASSAQLAPDVVSDASGFAIQRRKEKVGPIEEEVEYSTGQNGSMQRQSVWKVYPAADMLMQCFVKSNGGQVIRN